MSNFPKLCPDCGGLPTMGYAEGGWTIYIGCSCGKHTNYINVGNPNKGKYYQRVNLLYYVALKEWNEMVDSHA